MDKMFAIVINLRYMYDMKSNYFKIEPATNN